MSDGWGVTSGEWRVTSNERRVVEERQGSFHLMTESKNQYMRSQNSHRR